MGYYIQREDSEQGPYTRRELRGLLRDGEVARDTPARRETREEWNTVGAVLRKRSKKRPMEEEEEDEPVEDSSGSEDEDEGSFALGFIAGLIGGCIVLALVLRRGKPKTRTGVYWGLAFQVLIFAVAGSTGR